MKKFKPNLKKMFNFHTIILVLIFVVVSTLNSHTIEAKLQTNHKHHTQQHHNHHQQHNVVGDGGVGGDVEKDFKISVNDKQQHHNHHHQHSHHHNHDHNATPSLEFTTSSSAAASTSSSFSSSSSTSLSSDNEFLIKQEQQQEQPLLTNKDEIYYKTKDLKSFSSSSTTSKPSSLSIQLIKKQNLQNSLQSANKSNSRREHTHHHNHHRHIENYQRLKQAATLTKHHGGNFNNNNDDVDTQATMYSDIVNEESKNSKWNLATKYEKHHYYDHEKKPEFDANDRKLREEQQNYEDYYSDAEDETYDDDEDDEFNEDEGDNNENNNNNNDGITHDDDKNVSGRSYARITRSKHDLDYMEDEPDRNELQNDAPRSITDLKYSEVGNEKAVQQARERYLQEQKRPRTLHELAAEHWQRMIEATKCRKPMPRVIPVSNNTSKRYEPYATILHRCGDDTGCCGSTASVCTVKRQETVMVYVFSTDFNYRKEIEALPMQNHTECHCVNRASLLHDYMPRGKRSGGSGRLSAAVVGGLGSGSSNNNNNKNFLQHFQRSQNKKEHQLQQQQQYQQQFQYHEQQLQNMLDCHCPRHFNVFEEDVERHAHLPKPHSVFIRKCRCDCLVNNQTCLRFKHGEEGFSLEDRKCILDRNCKPPVCSYGEYNLRVGRCPSSRPHLPQMT